MAVVIENGFVGSVYPLNTPRIGYMPQFGTITASSNPTGFDGVQANNELTWSYWKPNSVPATWQNTFAIAKSISYIGIASHNMGTVGSTVEFQEWIGAAWVTIKSHIPLDDGPIMFLMNTRITDRMRIMVKNAIPTIGVIWMGSVVEFPDKCVFTGSLPFNESLQSVFTSNVSDGGHVVDRFELRLASNCSMTVKNLSETWAGTVGLTLQKEMRRLPIFMADRPTDYPNSIVFGDVPEILQMTREQPVFNASRSVTINVVGNQPT